MVSDKVLHAKVFKITTDPKYVGYQRGLTSMVYKFLHKALDISTQTGTRISENQKLANELQAFQ